MAIEEFDAPPVDKANKEGWNISFKMAVFLFLTLVGFVMIVVGIVSYSATITEITIQLNEGVDDFPETEKYALLSLKENIADYRVDLQKKDRWEPFSWQKIGSVEDQSAKDPITFQLNEYTPIKEVKAIRIRDQDPIESDILDESLILRGKAPMQYFHVTLKVERNYWDGAIRFKEAISGWLGIVIIVTIMTMLTG